MTALEMEHSSPNETTANHTDVSSSTSNATIISLAIITIPGVVTNSIALFFIIRDVRKAVFPAIILLLALCFADLVSVSLSAVRHLMMYFVTDMTYGLCASVSVTTTFFRIYSGILNAMMAIDRVIAVGLPFYYKRKIDVRRWKVGCLLTAVVTALFTCLPVVGFGQVMSTVEKNGHTKVICSTFRYREDLRVRLYGFMYAVIGFAITLTIVIGNVIVIKCILKLNNRIVNVNPLETLNSSGSDNVSSSNVTSFEIAFAKLMGCLAAVYLFTGTPYNTLILLQQLNKKVDHTTVGIIHLLGGLSYTIDPIVYILIRKVNRKRIINFFFRCRKNEVGVK